MEEFFTFLTRDNKNYTIEELREKGKSLIIDDIGKEYGCYVLRSLREICRLLGKDENGILYIGSGRRHLHERVNELQTDICVANGGELAWWSSEGKKPYHGVGKKYTKRVKEKFPVESLRVIVCPTPSQDDALKQEGKFLNDYKSLFGELPPFNDAPGKTEKVCPDCKRQFWGTKREPDCPFCAAIGRQQRL